jgi:hypothetical protein
MKKGLLYLILFLSVNSYGQYFKMPLDTGHYWRHRWHYYNPPADYDCEYNYKCTRDSVYNSKTYKIMKSTGNLCDASVAYSALSGIEWQTILLRQDTVKKLVVILLADSSEKILYNFNKNVGDTAKLFVDGALNTYTLQYKDSIKLNDGFYHKKFNFFSPWPGNIVEGLGSLSGFLPMNQAPLHVTRYLECVAVTGSHSLTLYPYGNTSCNVYAGIKETDLLAAHILLYPNPASHALSIQMPSSPDQIEIYNSVGEKVFFQQNEAGDLQQLDVSSFANGIYMVKIAFPGKSIYRRFVKE